MSLGIVFKGPEGTPPTLPPSPAILIPATFDNAIKLLKVKGQDYVGAVTYGIGAIGLTAPRTAHSFLPEFENVLKQIECANPVSVFATTRLC